MAALDDAVKHSFLDLPRIESEKRFELLASDARFRAIVDGIRDTRERAKVPLDALKVAPPDRPLPDAGVVHSPELFGSELASNLSQGKGRSIDIDLKDVEGRTLRLADLKGKAVLVQLWGSWSESSRKQLVDTKRVHDEYKAKGLEVLLLCSEVKAAPGAEKDVIPSVRATLRDLKIDLPCALIQTPYAERLGVGTYPTTIFVAADGKSYHNVQGYLAYSALRQMAEILLKGPAQ